MDELLAAHAEKAAREIVRDIMQRKPHASLVQLERALGKLHMTSGKPTPQKPSHVEQVQRTARRLTPKKLHQKSMEVFVDEHVRDGIKALAVIHNMPAQDYAERVLARDVELNDHLVTEGKRILEETRGNLTNARLKYLEEKVSHYER